MAFQVLSFHGIGAGPLMSLPQHRDNTELLQHAQIVRVVPMFDIHTACDSDDIDGRDDNVLAVV